MAEKRDLFDISEEGILEVVYDSKRVIPHISKHRFRVCIRDCYIDTYVTVEEKHGKRWKGFRFNKETDLQAKYLELAILNKAGK